MPQKKGSRIESNTVGSCCVHYTMYLYNLQYIYIHTVCCIFTILSRECCPSCSGFLGQKSAQLMATVGYLLFYNVTCYLVFAIFSDYNVDLSVIILQLLC